MPRQRLLLRLAPLLAPLLLLIACQGAPPVGRSGPVGTHHMISAAHPLAAEAGRDILRRGGSAVDAAIAAQMVLTVVEPQASGIGGGGLLLHYNRRERTVLAYDGRETAPASATADMFLDAAGQPLSLPDAILGGRSVGVPGAMRLLALAHREHGRLPWARLFDRAIVLAEEGFPAPPRLAALLAEEKALARSPQARAIYYRPDGSPKKAGETIVNRPLGATLRVLAARGAEAFYDGPIARDIAAAVDAAARRPGTMTLADLAAYRPIERPALCGPYRAWTVCGMPPVSSGGLAILQTLAMLERFDIAALAPNSAEAVHLVAEASRLAFADRDAYVGDPYFVQVPVEALLDPIYLARRAALISPARSAGRASPGQVAGMAAPPAGHTLEIPATSHLAVVDGDGNAVSFTTTIEAAFGSRIMVGGFLLNNELTDFAFTPEIGGKPVANRIEPGKRPRSSMSPTVILDGDGRLVALVGSAGGSAIIGTTLQTILGVLDWNLTMQAAIDQPRFLNRNGPTELEPDTPLVALKPALEALGHTVRIAPIASGVHGIRVQDGRYEGGADPRRDGAARGD